MITSDSIFTIEECNEIVGFLKTAGHLFEKQNKDNMSYSKWHLNDHSFKYKNTLQEYVNNKLNISSKDTDIIFIKYSKDDYMGTHVDKNNESEYHRDSMYNFNVRLNDDFEGGEFKLKVLCSNISLAFIGISAKKIKNNQYRFCGKARKRKGR